MFSKPWQPVADKYLDRYGFSFHMFQTSENYPHLPDRTTLTLVSQYNISIMRVKIEGGL